MYDSPLEFVPFHDDTRTPVRNNSSNFSTIKSLPLLPPKLPMVALSGPLLVAAGKAYYSFLQ
jgi:hypothetical protein